MIFITVFLQSSCQKAELETINNLNNGSIVIVGHGGIGFQSLTNQLPHNSFSSVIQAIERYNAEGVEIDVQMSKDLVLFMYHSKYLERMTDCTSCIHVSNSAHLDSCQFKKVFNWGLFQDEYLTRLNIVIDHFSKRDVPPLVFLDLKTFQPCETELSYEQYRIRLAQSVVDLINFYQAEDWIMVESSDIELLNIIKHNNDKIHLFLHQNQAPENIYLADKYELFGIVTAKDNITPEQVNLAHGFNLRVALYNARSRPGLLETIGKNPDYIQTDNIHLLQQILK